MKASTIGLTIFLIALIAFAPNAYADDTDEELKWCFDVDAEKQVQIPKSVNVAAPYSPTKAGEAGLQAFKDAKDACKNYATTIQPNGLTPTQELQTACEDICKTRAAATTNQTKCTVPKVKKPTMDCSISQGVTNNIFQNAVLTGAQNGNEDMTQVNNSNVAYRITYQTPSTQPTSQPTSTLGFTPADKVTCMLVAKIKGKCSCYEKKNKAEETGLN